MTNRKAAILENVRFSCILGKLVLTPKTHLTLDGIITCNVKCNANCERIVECSNDENMLGQTGRLFILILTYSFSNIHRIWYTHCSRHSKHVFNRLSLATANWRAAILNNVQSNPTFTNTSQRVDQRN